MPYKMMCRATTWQTRCTSVGRMGHLFQPSLLICLVRSQNKCNFFIIKLNIGLRYRHTTKFQSTSPVKNFVLMGLRSPRIHACRVSTLCAWWIPCTEGFPLATTRIFQFFVPRGTLPCMATRGNAVDDCVFRLAARMAAVMTDNVRPKA